MPPVDEPKNNGKKHIMQSYKDNNGRSRNIDTTKQGDGSVKSDPYHSHRPASSPVSVTVSHEINRYLNLINL